jgi:hypothetical protein
LNLWEPANTLHTFGRFGARNLEKTSVQYIHQTVKEFFKKSDFLGKKEQGSSLDSCECLLASCLYFVKISPRFRSDLWSISFYKDEIIEEILELIRLLEMSTRRPQTSILEELDRTLASCTPPNESWCDHFLQRSGRGWQSTIIGIAIYADLFLFVKEKLDSTKFCSSQNPLSRLQEPRRPLLHFAVCDRSVINAEMVEYLLNCGANPNENLVEFLPGST